MAEPEAGVVTLAPLFINGEPVTAGPRRRPQPPAPTPRARIFDHLDGSDPEEDRHFSRVAHAMRTSTWWRTVPTYAAPEPVAGELRAKTERGKRALCALNRLDAEDIALDIEIMDERKRERFVRALQRNT